MAHDVEVQKIVLLPRFTSFSAVGSEAVSFRTAPINVREFASAIVSVWTGPGIGPDPTFELELQQSPDLVIWNTSVTVTPAPETESSDQIDFEMEWLRLAVTIGAGGGFTCWAVGDFVTRARRS